MTTLAPYAGQREAPPTEPTLGLSAVELSQALAALDPTTADDLAYHLRRQASEKRRRVRADAEEATAALVGMMGKPALGAYRKAPDPRLAASDGPPSRPDDRLALRGGSISASRTSPDDHDDEADPPPCGTTKHFRHLETGANVIMRSRSLCY